MNTQENAFQHRIPFNSKAFCSLQTRPSDPVTLKAPNRPIHVHEPQASNSLASHAVGLICQLLELMLTYERPQSLEIQQYCCPTTHVILTLMDTVINLLTLNLLNQIKNSDTYIRYFACRANF